MQITQHKVVTIDYTLTGDDGAVLDTSRGGEPLAYLHGAGNLIPGLERALDGRVAGDRFQVSIAPEDAYGPRDERLRQTVAREMFEDQGLEVGAQFMAHMAGAEHIFTVVDIQGERVTIDGNHPLAGVSLNFDVTVRSVRDATAEEVSHGHVHGPHGH